MYLVRTWPYKPSAATDMRIDRLTGWFGELVRTARAASRPGFPAQGRCSPRRWGVLWRVAGPAAVPVLMTFDPSRRVTDAGGRKISMVGSSAAVVTA
jgi:hypothetical protein